TIWLFPYEQLFDTVIPCTIFAICGALSGDVLDLQTVCCLDDVGDILSLFAFLWLWLVILQFCLHNQRQPGSIAKDAINKPWRTLLAKGIFVASVNRILLAVYYVVPLTSYTLG
ncbi:hypothetical protein AOQ84DRAFT_274955, partial [Glonium stellatum]